MAFGPLVTTADLAAALGRTDLRILDIRSAVDGGGRAAFEAAHIPGATHTDYVTDGWRAVKGAAAGALPDAEALATLFGRLGVTPHDAVVIVPAGVSASDFAAAARIYWTFKVAGHGALAMLDGGMAAWSAEGRPVEAGPGAPPAPARYPVTIDPRHRAVLEDVAAALASGSATLVDSRGPASFAGTEKSGVVARAGRLPGAVLVEGAQAYDPARGRLRPLPDLERLFAPVPAGESIPYCNTGQQAATDWFVLSELLGRSGTRLYDGSMSEWTADPARPVETGG